MEPFLPSGSPELEYLAREVVSWSAALGGQFHHITQRSVVELLRLINSYYSNLIEGHSTHPVDIERAMREVESGESWRESWESWWKAGVKSLSMTTNSDCQG